MAVETKTCSTCGGCGTIKGKDKERHMDIYVTCPTCKGSGTVNR